MGKERLKPLEVYFYATAYGNEPVREWLKDLPKEDKKVIGQDIKTVQFGYPIGMPLTRVLHNTEGLEEVRSDISNKCIARVIFYVEDNTIFLLHGFVKKDKKTPKKDLDLAIKRYKELCKR